MDIEKSAEAGSVTLAVSGRLTAVTAEELSGVIDAALGETKKLLLDFNELDFVASAGLRVIISAKKHLDAAGGELIIRNVRENVMQVFELVGLNDILTFE